MKLGMKRLFVTSILVCMVLTLLTPGCGQPPPVTTPEPPSEQTPESTLEPSSAQSEVYTATSAPSSLIKAQLSLTGTPILYEPVQVTFTFALREVVNFDAENATARIILPNGFELVDGDLEWQGDIIRGTPVTIKATIRAIKTGDWNIEAGAGFSPGKGHYLKGSANLYISVFEDSATVSDRVPISEPGWSISGERGKSMEPTLPPVPPIEDWMVPKMPEPETPASSSARPPAGAEGSSLTIRGYVECGISENALPQEGQERARCPPQNVPGTCTYNQPDYSS